MSNVRLILVTICFICNSSLVGGHPLQNFISDMLQSMDETADPCEDFHRYSCGGWLDKYCPKDDGTSLLSKLHSGLHHTIWSFLESLQSRRNLNRLETILSDNFRLCLNSASTEQDEDRILNDLRSSIDELRVTYVRGESKVLRILRFEAAVRREFGVSGGIVEPTIRIKTPHFPAHFKLLLKAPEISCEKCDQFSSLTDDGEISEHVREKILLAYVGELMQIYEKGEIRLLLSDYSTSVEEGSAAVLKKLESISESEARRIIVDNAETQLQEQMSISRSQQCLNYVQKHSVGALTKSYITRLLKEDALELKSELELFVNAIFSAFPTLIGTNRWMSLEDKVALINHIDDVRFHLAMPNWSQSENDLLTDTYRYNASVSCLENDRRACQSLRRDSAQRLVCLTNKDNQNQLIYNALYSAESNGIYFLLGAILEPSFVAGKSLLPVRYGRLGFTVGHELMHSAYRFVQRRSDQLGRTYHQSNDLVHKCVRDIYKEAVRRRNLTDLTPSTVFEDIPDVEGLKLAYLAFNVQKLIARQPRKPSSIAGFSDDQLFFISHANQWCGCQKIKIDDELHSLSRLRAEIPAWEMPEFGRAFRCGPRSAYGRRKKCNVYSNLDFIDV